MTIKEVSEKYGISQDTLRYYERVKVIPAVTRTSGGIRDYQAGDETIPARLELLQREMEILQKQKEQIEETMGRLSYKIERYEEAMRTGKLIWTKKENNNGKTCSILFKSR